MIEAFPNAQPLQGLAGGVLIGLAAALMLLGAGRIAGVSGIAARATRLADGGMAMTSAWGFLSACRSVPRESRSRPTGARPSSRHGR